MVPPSQPCPLTSTSYFPSKSFPFVSQVLAFGIVQSHFCFCLADFEILVLTFSPVCRQVTKRVIPSSSFFPLNSPSREEYIKHYTETLGTKPCRYFEASKKNVLDAGTEGGTDGQGQGNKGLYCPFLNKCLFVHEVEGEKYVFSKSEIRRTKAARKLRLYQFPFPSLILTFAL